MEKRHRSDSQPETVTIYTNNENQGKFLSSGLEYFDLKKRIKKNSEQFLTNCPLY